MKCDKLKWKWAYFPYLDAPEKQHESAVNAGYVKVLLKAEVDAAIAELNAENRRLKRALWLARANNARNSYLKWNLFANFESEDKLFTIDKYDETPGATDGNVLRTYTEWVKIWQNVERKCLKKAEEYK